MTASDMPGEGNTSVPDTEYAAELLHRRSRTFRNMLFFVSAMALGLLPLFLFLLNHLTIASPLFSFQLSLTFCTPRPYMPTAKIGILDPIVVYILYPVEAFLGIPAVIGIGKVFHWRKSTMALCASGLLLAVVLEFVFYWAFLFPISWRQCFHLVG
jgi:hypothetical protein